MSYNGSGTFNINSTGQPVVAGTVITASAFNALTTDLATGLTTAITKDGQTTTTARITFAQGITSSLVTDSSSVSTGSIITAGGAGIAKNLYVGVNANVAGTLGVTGVATFSAAPIYSSLTASSAVATDASKGLVSVTNTGTGNNVLATSPTITTPTISSLSSASATALTLQSAGTTAISVDTSQNVGIGVTPSTWTSTKAIEVGSLGTALWSSGAGSSTLTSGAYYNSGWKYANATSKPSILDFDNTGKVTYYAATATSTAGSAISFTQLLAVEAGKSLALQGATTQTGTGITFPATQSASSDANTLDDYEEGTWTPTDTSGAGLTFTSINAYYTKVGRMVTLNASFTFPSTASGANTSFGGIPFSYGFSNAETCMAIFDNAGLGANQVYFAAIGFDIRAAGTNTLRTNANFSGKRIHIMASYSTSV